jgi:hypothetical protein
MNKYMTAEEFFTSGLLQEVNRQFLHPRGLSLGIIVDENKDYKFTGVWDARDDPEGFFFYQAPDPAKCKAVEDMLKTEARQKTFGWVIQPPGQVPSNGWSSRQSGDELMGKIARLLYVLLVGPRVSDHGNSRGFSARFPWNSNACWANERATAIQGAVNREYEDIFNKEQNCRW